MKGLSGGSFGDTFEIVYYFIYIFFYFGLLTSWHHATWCFSKIEEDYHISDDSLTYVQRLKVALLQ